MSLRLFNAGTTSFLFLVWKRMSTRCRILREVSLVSKALVNGAMLVFHLLVFHISLFFYNLKFNELWAFFFRFIYFFLLLLFFSLLLFFYNMILTLNTLRFLSRDSLRTLRYTTYLQYTVSTQYTVRRIRYSLWAGSHLEPVRKLYRNNSAWSILSHFCWNLFCESVTIDICFSISKLYFSRCWYSLIDGDMFLNIQQ